MMIGGPYMHDTLAAFYTWAEITGISGDLART